MNEPVIRLELGLGTVNTALTALGQLGQNAGNAFQMISAATQAQLAPVPEPAPTGQVTLLPDTPV